MNQIGDRLAGQEQHLGAVVLHVHLGLGHDEHDSDHAAVLAEVVHVDLTILAAGSRNAGCVLDASIGGVLVGVLGILNHKQGLGVGGHGSAVHINAGLVVLQNEVGNIGFFYSLVIATLVLLGGNFLQRVDIVGIHLVSNNGVVSNIVAVVFLGGDYLGGAVGKQELGLLADEVTLVGGGQHQGIVLSGQFLFLDVNDIAIGIQVDGVVVLHAHVTQQLTGNGPGGLVSGISNGQPLIFIVRGFVDNLGHGAGDFLSCGNRLHFLSCFRVGVQDIGVLLELLVGLELQIAALGGHDIQGGDNHIGVLLRSGGHVFAHLAHIGVDLGDSDGAVILVIEDFGQHTVGTELGVIVTLLDGHGQLILHVGVILGGNAVHIHRDIVLGNGLVQAQILVDVSHFHLSGVGGVSILGIGADLVGLQGPDVGGASKVILAAVIQSQISEVLLSKLHLAIGIDVLVALAVVLHIGTAGSGVDGDVTHNDGVLLVILHHGGLQHVERIQGSLLAGHGLGAHELVVAVVQANAHGLLDDGHGPVGAGVALDGAVIAQSAQQHLHERVAAQGAGGTEGAVSIAADDTLLRAVGDVAREGVGHGNILEGGGACAQSGGSGGAQDQVADDLGGRTAGQDIIGTEVAAGITVDNAQSRDHIHSFFVGDLAVVREVLGAGADGDQRHGHHQSKHQRKELLHLGFLLL